MKKWIINNNPIASLITAFIILLLFFACSNSQTSRKNNQQEQKKSEIARVIYKKPASSFSDTLIIQSRSAVFYNPDSLQLQKIKAITENRVYESDVHDCFYQMRNARMVLKKYWPQIHIIETSKTRYLLFIKSDKSKTCIDLDTKGDMCGIFLFDREQDPGLCDMMNIDTALGFYFSK